MFALFLKFISLLFMGLFIFGVAIMLLTWRKAKFVKPKWIIFGQVVAFLSIAIFSILARNPIGGLGWLILVVVGLAAGVVYANTVKVQQTARGIMMNYTLPYIITWATLLAITQFVTITSGRVPLITLGLAILNMGLNLGLNGRIVWLYQKIKKGGTLRG